MDTKGETCTHLLGVLCVLCGRESVEWAISTHPPRALLESEMKLRMLSSDDKLAEIRRLYFAATRETIDADLARALDLLKSMGSEGERERATVYMEGLAQMRSDWAGRKKRKSKR